MLDKALNTVILSDVHLGKTYHFRKNGFAVPIGLAKKNIDALQLILEKHIPKKLLILGDLFHSRQNAEWEDFKALRYHYSNVNFHLIIGNHDTFPIKEYLKANIEVYEHFLEDDFLYSHEPMSSDRFNIYGHIHPAIRLRGQSLPSLRFPCFYMNKKELIMPAFGAFTGTHVLKANSKAKIFAIAENKIFEPLPSRSMVRRTAS